MGILKVKKRIEYIRLIRDIYRSPFFNKKWYLDTYPNARRSIIPAFMHYMLVGYKKDYDPSPIFSGWMYRRMNNILHEACPELRRRACPELRRRACPELRRRDICPLYHFFKYKSNDDPRKYDINEGRIKDYHRDYILTQDDIDKTETIGKCKRVLLVSHEASLTGAPLALLNLGKVLKDAGYHVVYFSMQDGPIKEQIKDAGIFFKVPFDVFYAEKFRDCAEVDYRSYINLFDFVLLNTTVSLAFSEQIKGTKPKKFCWIHEGSFFHFIPEYDNYLRKYLPNIDRCFVVGDYCKRITQRYNKSDVKPEILLYGIEQYGSVANQKWPDKADKLRIVVAGAIEERKGQKVIAQCLKILPNEIRDRLSIIVVGKTYNKEIETMMKDYNCPSLVVVGEKSHEELLGLMNEMDILLCPSLDDPMPIVCTEAFMLKKTVIVSNATGTASFIKDSYNGYVVESNNPKALADMLVKTINSVTELPAMGQRAYSIYKENFSMEVFRKNVLDVFS